MARASEEGSAPVEQRASSMPCKHVRYRPCRDLSTRETKRDRQRDLWSGERPFLFPLSPFPPVLPCSESVNYIFSVSQCVSKIYFTLSKTSSTTFARVNFPSTKVPLSRRNCVSYRNRFLNVCILFSLRKFR